jgi:hypothetical protein
LIDPNNDSSLVKKRSICTLNGHGEGEVVASVKQIRWSVIVTESVERSLPEVGAGFGLQRYLVVVE